MQSPTAQQSSVKGLKGVRRVFAQAWKLGGVEASHYPESPWSLCPSPFHTLGDTPDFPRLTEEQGGFPVCFHQSKKEACSN